MLQIHRGLAQRSWMCRGICLQKTHGSGNAGERTICPQHVICTKLMVFAEPAQLHHSAICSAFWGEFIPSPTSGLCSSCSTKQTLGFEEAAPRPHLHMELQGRGTARVCRA